MRYLFVIASLASLGINSVMGAQSGSICSGSFTAPEKVAAADSVLIVTHPSPAFDVSFASKDGIDNLVKFAKRNAMTTIYLQNTDPKDVYVSDCDPDYWLKSAAGEHGLQLSSSQVYFAGGYWEECQDSTISDVIRSWSAQRPPRARLIQITDAIYLSGTYVYPTDEFYPRYLALLKSKTAPIGEIPTLTLKELLGLMKDKAQRIEFLKRNLPNVGYLPDDYEVELVIDGRAEGILKASKDPNNKKLVIIEFMDSIPK